MRPPLPRKSRISPAVEALEDRRLLSFAGPHPAWDGSALTPTNHADLAPAIQGPGLATRGDAADPTWPGSTDRADPSPAFESVPDAPAANAPLSRDFSASPTFTPQRGVDPTPPQAGQGWDEAPNPAGYAPMAGTTPTPAARFGEEIESLGTAGAIGARGSGEDSPPVAATAVQPASPPARVSTAGQAPRSVENLVQAPHASSEASARPDSLPAGETPLPGIVTSPVDANPSLVGPTHETSPLSMASGQGSLAARAQGVLDAGKAKAASEGRSPDGTPGSPIPEPGGAEGRRDGQGLAQARDLEGLDRPEPLMADMILGLMPFDRSALDRVVDRFLEPFEGLSSMPGMNGPLGLLAASLTLAVTVLAVDASLRIRRSREQDGETPGDDDLVGYPGLPGLGGGLTP